MGATTFRHRSVGTAKKLSLMLSKQLPINKLMVQTMLPDHTCSREAAPGEIDHNMAAAAQLCHSHNDNSDVGLGVGFSFDPLDVQSDLASRTLSPDCQLSDSTEDFFCGAH